MKIAIVRHYGEWHFADHQERGARPQPHRLSEGYPSKAEATQAAIEILGPEGITITGTADKATCRAFHVPFEDPRGNKRGGSVNAEIRRQSGRIWAQIKSGEIATNGDFTRAVLRLVDDITE